MQRPKIKDIHRPVRLRDHRIQIGTTLFGVAAEIPDADGRIWRLIDLMDGTRSRPEIVEGMQEEFPSITGQEVLSAISELSNAGFVEDEGALLPARLDGLDIERYARSANYFALVDTRPRRTKYDAQQRLKDSRVTILGLGGSGSSAAMALVASGVGSVHCLDFDRVTLGNLNRQLLYSEDDLGSSKVERAVTRLRRMNSRVEVTGAEIQVRAAGDVVPLMDSCDLFILCADSPPTLIQEWTNIAALSTKTPWLEALYAGPMAVTCLYVPFQTPCRDCRHQHEVMTGSRRWEGEPLPRHREAAPAHAVVAPSAGITGHLAALEALYFLAGLQPQTLGRAFHQNLMMYDHAYYVTPPVWEECPSCGPTSPYR